MGEVLKQKLAVPDQRLEETEARKRSLNCHRMKAALFGVLCEIKKKTGISRQGCRALPVHRALCHLQNHSSLSFVLTGPSRPFLLTSTGGALVSLQTQALLQATPGGGSLWSQRAGMCCGPCPPDRPARPASRQGPASAATLVSSSLTGSPSPSEHVDAPQTTSVPHQGPVGWPVGASFLPGKHVHVMAQATGSWQGDPLPMSTTSPAGDPESVNS
ncbi:Pre-B-cell leukemia transcription factor 2 [Manis javanica]|nr:Pre-B-cell leukemia transcription factor 2 [Manis javanica]